MYNNNRNLQSPVCQSSLNLSNRCRRNKGDRKRRQQLQPDHWWGVRAFFTLLKIMVTYISFNEGNYQFLLPSLCARSFVFNEINATAKQWMLAFCQSTWGKKKGTRMQQRVKRERKQRRGSEWATGMWYSPSSSWKPNRRRDSMS